MRIQFLVGKPLGMREVILAESKRDVFEKANWIKMAEDRALWRDFVNKGTNFTALRNMRFLQQLSVWSSVNTV
jgi:hypothetical protein